MFGQPIAASFAIRTLVSCTSVPLELPAAVQECRRNRVFPVPGQNPARICVLADWTAAEPGIAAKGAAKQGGNGTRITAQAPGRRCAG